jgi:hypothetical protein
MPTLNFNICAALQAVSGASVIPCRRLSPARLPGPTMFRYKEAGLALSRLALATGGLFLIVSQFTQLSAQQRHSGEAGTPAPAVQMSGDVERGRYIVENVAMCGECHSPRDAQGNLIPGQRFHGGPIPVAPPWINAWANRAPRIAGLPGYTDELAVRLLTQGAISRKGTQLRLPMPRFHMDEKDALAVAAYLRSIQ